MRSKLAALAGATVLGVGALASTASAATHLAGDFTFPDTVCGIAVQHELSFIDNFGSKADGSSWDAGQIVETFTAANGRGVRITFLAGHEENAALVQNPDGTTTQVYTYAGLDVKTQAVGGPVLEQGTGLVQVTVIFDVQGNVLSVSVVALAGPNPNLTGAPDCGIVGPYLAGA
jgi:hypothetical protein